MFQLWPIQNGNSYNDFQKGAFRSMSLKPSYFFVSLKPFFHSPYLHTEQGITSKNFRDEWICDELEGLL